MRELLAELRALRRMVERRREVLGAVCLEKAAVLLDLSLAELRLMARTGLIEVVKYGPKMEPRIPVEEILRLTSPRPRA